MAEKELNHEISRETLERLLRIRGETDNLDFKLIFSLSLPKEKAELVRDILAFANTKDGGHLIYGVTDEEHTPVGLPLTGSLPKEDRKIDTTTIYKALQKFLSANIQLKAAEYNDIQWPEWSEKKRFGIRYF